MCARRWMMWPPSPPSVDAIFDSQPKNPFGLSLKKPVARPAFLLAQFYTLGGTGRFGFRLGAVTPLSPPQLTALRALLDRLIPADDFPGAVEAGTEYYILRQLAGDCAAEAPVLAAGLSQLDAEAAALDGREGGGTFATLVVEQQGSLLRDLEAGKAATAWPNEIGCATFFNRLVDLAHEGFYADPGNAGNRGAVSWAMLGYATRTKP